ncbi:hypothetical protein [Paenibacillus oceani]|uniref:hypothetical protein n=1 Tax=Paenibacillus oceani TaxID=2772510 RepID=UPI001CC23D0F|nr:hypothetical protein [Paenibacillus oceani]
MQAWSKIQPHMDQPDVEDLPEWERFSEAFQWQIPWADAAEQLRLNLPGTLDHFPSLAAPVHEWLETLSTHVQRYSAAVIYLELSQYFSFTGDPALYLKDIQKYVTLWQSPHPSQEKVWQGAGDNFYMLNGEHLPWRERTVAQPEQAPKFSQHSPFLQHLGSASPNGGRSSTYGCLRFCPQPSFLPSMSRPPVVGWRCSHSSSPLCLSFCGM